MGILKLVAKLDSVWVAWGPYLQLATEVKAVFLGALFFNMWDVVLTVDSECQN